MLAGAAAVDYIATGAPAGSGDAEWDARVREHQRRRPPRWRTIETLALDEVLAAPDAAAPGTAAPDAPALDTRAPGTAAPGTAAPGTGAPDAVAAGTAPPALVDCLTVWLARVMDESGAWDDSPGAEDELTARLDRFVMAWQDTRREVVAVSNEIGAGVVPETASGRRFRDELGRLNARIAASSDEVWYCTAGIPRRLR
jgi:adenosylcobinamide kinase/adenosylcobinamide-phosphate guanylyltransferase